MNKMTLAGLIGALGLVIQIILGFALAGQASITGNWFIFPHMLIGIAGIALVAFFTASIFFTPSSMIVRLIYALALVLTLAQVLLGFALLSQSGSDQMLVMSHQGIAIVILVILLVGGMLSGRESRKSMMMAAAAPV